MTEPIEILRFEPSGDLYWKGRKVESDAELREAVIDLHRHFCNYQVVQNQVINDPAEIRRVFEIDAAEWSEPESGFMKMEGM